MYTLDFPPIHTPDPWKELGFGDRYSMLCRRRGWRVAYVYRTPDTSTFRYRCWNMVEVLNHHSHRASAGCFYLTEYERAEQIVESADVIVLCRVAWDHRANRFISLARAKNRVLLFDIDDMVFDPSTIYVVMKALGVGEREEDWDHWFAYASRHQNTLKACDGHIATNPELSAMLAECLPDGRCSIIPNFLNSEQLEVSRRAMKEKVRRGFARDGAIHIGYFSGTPTHSKDFAVAEAALATLMDEHPQVRLYLVGFIEPSGELSRHVARIDRHELTNYRNLQLLMARTEICIAPLDLNLFSNCKSELKWFEAAVTGAVTVASPSDPFRNAIADGKNGFLAPAGSWHQKMTEALQRVGDLEFVQRACSDAEARYGWSRMNATIERAIFAD